MMQSVPLTSRLLALLGLVLIIASCAQASSPQTSATPTVHRSIPTVLPTSQPTATATPTPPPLGPVPQDCPPGPSPRPLFSELAPVLGGGKVWFTWMDGPHAVIHFTGIDDYTSPYGHTSKLVWEVGPPPVGLVTIRGENLRTHQPLWLQFDDTPTTDAVLDPQHPNHPVSVVDISWAEWGSYLFIPAAGCYTLSASWPGGQWHIFFAAGRSPWVQMFMSPAGWERYRHIRQEGGYSDDTPPAIREPAPPTGG